MIKKSKKNDAEEKYGVNRLPADSESGSREK